jgi:hypothetical protein
MVFEHFLYVMQFFDLSVNFVNTQRTAGCKPPGTDSVYVAFDCNNNQSVALFDAVRQMFSIGHAAFFEMIFDFL